MGSRVVVMGFRWHGRQGCVGELGDRWPLQRGREFAPESWCRGSVGMDVDRRLYQQGRGLVPHQGENRRGSEGGSSTSVRGRARPLWRTLLGLAHTLGGGRHVATRTTHVLCLSRIKCDVF
jgi:hypothetical protein